MFARQIDIQETPTRLEDLIALIQQGTEILLVDGGTPVARLISTETPGNWQHIPNLHPGDWMSDELPDEFWLGN